MNLATLTYYDGKFLYKYHIFPIIVCFEWISLCNEGQEHIRILAFLYENTGVFSFLKNNAHSTSVKTSGTASPIPVSVLGDQKYE